MRDCLTNNYKIASKNYLDKINSEAALLIKELNIKGKVKKLHEKRAFITVKDHKKSFPNLLECRLINTMKSEIGIVSKRILDKINNNIRSKTCLVQWKNSFEVIEWFNKIKNKKSLNFLKFDIEKFYPSITSIELSNALTFAENYIKICSLDKRIIFHSCMSVLSDTNGRGWTKKNDSNNFDVAMGSYMGAEICDLIGLYILFDLNSVNNLSSFGLYRDDGLAVLKRSKCENERATKRIRSIFKNHGFKISVECNLTQTDFLDISMDLCNNTYSPYRKENANVKYINNGSNHPKLIRKSISSMINKRLSRLSSNDKIFNSIKKDYDEALTTSGHDRLKGYNIPNSDYNSKKTRRPRKIIYFNPPFCNSVKTKIGKRFLDLVRLHFPKSNKLHKIFNKNTIKISYSCLPNMRNIINAHNKK